jgi:hypothetical protein
MIKLDRNEETAYRQYYKALQTMRALADNEIQRYESGEKMTGGLNAPAADVIKYGSVVELLNDFMIEEK